MPNLFHCHECDKPTPNKNGLCDKHQPDTTITLAELSQPEIYSRNQDKKVAEIARREKV